MPIEQKKISNEELNHLRDLETHVMLKLQPEVVMRDVAGSSVVVPTGKYSQNFNGLITVNEYTKAVLKQFEKPRTVAEAMSNLKSEYEHDDDAEMEEQIRSLIKVALQSGLLLPVVQCKKPVNE